MRFSLCCVFLGAGLLFGCGEMECEPFDGTYLAATSERSGTCGPVGETLVQMRDGEQVGGDAGCVVDYDRVTENNCKTERSVTCTSQADGLVITGVGVFEADDESGSSASGVLTMTVKSLSTGATQCSSTYDVTYTRQ